MGCCLYCCLGEEDKVDRIIDRFSSDYALLSSVQPGALPNLIAGRIMPSNENILYSPIRSMPCVFYRVVAEELEERIVSDEAKKEKRVERQWRHRYTEEKAVDFFLCDPSTKSALYIPLSQVKHHAHPRVKTQRQEFKPNTSRPSAFQVKPSFL